ncbi:MAG: alanyl-tRNA synthetase [Sphingobacteriales bacterium]|jgi:alanyl-tRNA synthetase
MNASQIRQAFFDFFEKKGHKILSSAPMVVKNDPTLMFTNAGMNQFKAYFLGETEPKNTRVANSQKCLRVSGKHNDLEEVGLDTYHHTMFEMLGNWSFGDYFKEEAIAFAWELLTEVYKLPKERLFVTVFEGDKSDNLPADEEAATIWKSKIDQDRILYCSKKDNFWEMGETGPCGPCSEIHIDLRSDAERQKVEGKTLVNSDHPQVIEIWNLVFIQFNRKSDNSLVNLPARHVDTGMGFERLCMAMQGKISNYDTDVFTPLIDVISKKAKIAYGQNESQDIAMRVMADHIRATAFAIADGQLPSNVKAGYVIRRILRRAIRYAYSYLDIKEPVMYSLVPILCKQFSGVFPELEKQEELVSKVVFEEEQSFLRTLTAGIQRFNQYVNGNKSSQIIDGEFAFELFDTFGFPLDLTALMAREIGKGIDQPGFDKAMEEQKSRSRKATEMKTGDWIELVPSKNPPIFKGYDNLEVKTRLLKYRKVEVKKKEQFQLVLEETPFYPEGGGQVGDKGRMMFGSEILNVFDTKKENDLIIHFVNKFPSNPKAEVTAIIDAEKRQLSANNHSATHILHAALKQVLGDHVNQKGSLVNDQHLRFDFSHFSKITDEELTQIESIVNNKIRGNINLDERRNVPIAEAKSMGAIALFGEKYGDSVRVITFDPQFSVELCGGTHVKSTGEIGIFKITVETSVAAGIRRIEAITGLHAQELLFNRYKMVDELGGLLKSPTDPIKGVNQILSRLKSVEKELEQAVKSQAGDEKEILKAKITEVNGIKVLISETSVNDAGAVKDLAFELKEEVDNLYLVLGFKSGEKAMLTVMISDLLVKEKGLHAGNIVREISKNIQGGGGGQPFFATAGGKNPEGIPAALEQAMSFVK